MKTAKKVLTIGQTVFVKGNQFTSDKTIYERKITKVGKSICYLDNNSRFFIDTMLVDRIDYTSIYKVYLSKEDIQIEDEIKMKYRELNEYFSRNPSLDLEQLNKILEIIKS